MRTVRASTKNARFPLLKNNKKRAVGDLNSFWHVGVPSWCFSRMGVPTCAFDFVLSLCFEASLLRVFCERVSLNHAAFKKTQEEKGRDPSTL